MYLSIFYKFSKREQVKFIIESHKFEKIFGITFYPKKFIFLSLFDNIYTSL